MYSIHTITSMSLMVEEFIDSSSSSDDLDIEFLEDEDEVDDGEENIS